MSFSADNQLLYALTIFCSGAIAGLFYVIPTILHSFHAKLPFVLLSETVFVFLFLFSYCFVVSKFGFPNFRMYFPICFLLGFIVYFKTFNKVLAKVLSIVYNKLNKMKTERCSK